MKIDAIDIVKKSEQFALDLANQMSRITIRPLQKISFNSKEFRDRTTLKKQLHKIETSTNPIIYVIEIKSKDKVKLLVSRFEHYHTLNKTRTKNIDKVNLSRYNRTQSSVLYVGS